MNVTATVDIPSKLMDTSAQVSEQKPTRTVSEIAE